MDDGVSRLVKRPARNIWQLNQVLRAAHEAEARKDHRQAIQLFKKASRLGSTSARSMLGTIFDDRLRVPDPGRAAFWYRRGVQGGDSSCAWNMAMHHAGCQNRRWYLYWLRVAKKMGDKDAATELVSERWWDRGGRVAR